MPSIIYLIFFWFLFGCLWRLPAAEGAFERAPLVPQVAARGGTSVGWAEGKAAFLWNPAAKISSRAVLSTAYSQPYGIDDFGEGLLNYTHTVRDRGSLGLSWYRLHTTGYHEDRRSAAISYGNRLARAGVRLDQLAIHIDGFGSRSALGVSFGGLWHIHTGLRLGLALNSLNRPKIPNSLPRSVALGIGVQATPDLLLFADLRHAADVDVQLLAGVELAIGQHLVLRGGMHNQPWEFTAGWGLRIRSIVVDYAWLNHARLDGTHQLAIGWNFTGSE
ncbi:MAG: hypothetical protein O7E52_29125 [Candidatus Poribacteria bacterium]|nr:hypothetical protein [Candidatus Poribacteria bacterium]